MKLGAKWSLILRVVFRGYRLEEVKDRQTILHEKTSTHYKRIEPWKSRPTYLDAWSRSLDRLTPRSEISTLNENECCPSQDLCISVDAECPKSIHKELCRAIFWFFFGGIRGWDLLVSGPSATMADHTAQRRIWSFQAGLAAILGWDWTAFVR